MFKPVWDHPRVCGEKVSFFYAVHDGLGSPPRMRGKGTHLQVETQLRGITPAYAGKSACGRCVRLTHGDHPRVCGEKFFRGLPSRSCRGSPPRMRGKVVFQLLPASAAGITPAYAGKRLKRSHSIGHFSCILCLFHSVLHRASVSDGSRAGPCAPPCLPAQNAVPV